MPPCPEANTRGTLPSGGDNFPSRRDDAHAAGPFGHQHAAVGQESKPPGNDQAARDGLDLQIAARALENLLRGRRIDDKGQQSCAGNETCLHG